MLEADSETHEEGSVAADGFRMKMQTFSFAVRKKRKPQNWLMDCLNEYVQSSSGLYSRVKQWPKANNRHLSGSWKMLYFEVLDHFNSEFNQRFTDNEDLVDAVQAFNCFLTQFYKCKIKNFAKQYDKHIDETCWWLMNIKLWSALIWRRLLWTVSS